MKLFTGILLMIMILDFVPPKFCQTYDNGNIPEQIGGLELRPRVEAKINVMVRMLSRDCPLGELRDRRGLCRQRI